MQCLCFGERGGHDAEAERFYAEALNAEGPARDEVEARVLMNRGLLLVMADHMTEAEPCLERALRTGRSIGERWLTDGSLRGLAWIAHGADDLDGARVLFEEALAETPDDSGLINTLLQGLGSVETDAGNLERARELPAEPSLTLARRANSSSARSLYVPRPTSTASKGSSIERTRATRRVSTSFAPSPGTAPHGPALPALPQPRWRSEGISIGPVAYGQQPSAVLTSTTPRCFRLPADDSQPSSTAAPKPSISAGSKKVACLSLRSRFRTPSRTERPPTRDETEDVPALLAGAR